MAKLPFRFRFFFQAALDGVRPPKPVFMILDVRYLDSKTPLQLQEGVWSASAHLLKSFLNALLPLEPDAQTEVLESLPSNLVPSVPWVRKKVIHAAIFITTDIVFTKNGYDFTQPWILMRKSDMLEVYKARYPASTLQPIYFRKRTI